ncbi:MAG: DNA primase, partial [Flavobacteriales bacterium]|nr:DNA primase [Flavobacteriales bacterium]
MEISEIKSNLSITQVLEYYGISVNKNKMISCVFHEDKNPSMQVYENTNTVYCFSGNCKTHGKSLDVIDFVMYYENLSKHEAISKCKEIILPTPSKGGELVTRNKPPKKNNSQSSASDFLESIFQYFSNAINSSKPAKEYLASRALNLEKLTTAGSAVGYNSGQFHHGARRDEQLISQALEVGLLIDKNLVSKTGNKAYGVFGNKSLVFPLRNISGDIVSFYFRSILSSSKDKTPAVAHRHFYLKNRQGLYPSYPSKETKKLILTESIIDASSLLQNKQIAENYSLLACY